MIMYMTLKPESLYLSVSPSVRLDFYRTNRVEFPAGLKNDQMAAQAAPSQASVLVPERSWTPE